MDRLFYDPHCILGLHPGREGKVLRVWRPGLQEAYACIRGHWHVLHKETESGLFSLLVPEDLTAEEYTVSYANGVCVRDPYTFPPSLGEMDQYLFSKGVHYQIYEVLGGRLCECEGVAGASFCVWAPSAYSVFLLGDFNHWNDRTHPMRSLGGCGIWEIFLPKAQEGDRYKFAVVSQTGQQVYKSDPFATHCEKRPANASCLFDVDRYCWQDELWQERKKQLAHSQLPMFIYEVHLGSWKKEGEDFPNYRAIAPPLCAYVKEMGFTHIELLPIAEHPLDESWGYQVSAFYAVTSRYGSPRDFQYFVDYMHREGIGVFVDFVAAHFPKDDFALARFDGTALYEHEDSRQGYHPHWHTHIFNYGRLEVSNFLLGSALFFLDKMHIDGLRVDAVASMLYLDYGRRDGEWIPNCYGGRENLEAIEFLKHMNSIIHERFPGTWMMAEESTAFPKVTHPLDRGGLGFDSKWNMGWMNDTLSYFQKDPFFRNHHHHLLTFGLMYAFSESFMLVLSHDEVVHGKGSLLAKMPGDMWQKAANVRLLYSYMVCQPGKKLLFMGGEIGQFSEWNVKGSVDWFLLEDPVHQGIQNMVKDIHTLAKAHPALWENDHSPEGFAWVSCGDEKNCVLSYLRKAEGDVLLCVHNCTPMYFSSYTLPLYGVTSLREVFCSDREEYGGSGKVGNCREQEQSVRVELAPLATMIFEVSFG